MQDDPLHPTRSTWDRRDHLGFELGDSMVEAKSLAEWKLAKGKTGSKECMV